MVKDQIGLLLCCMLLLFFNCTNKQKTRMWARSFPNEGTNSSLRTADLNGDGTLDFVIGGGKRLHQSTDKGVIAINGRNGHILWKVATEDQIFGSATFLDITGDGYPDVFIGGRLAGGPVGLGSEILSEGRAPKAGYFEHRLCFALRQLEHA